MNDQPRQKLREIVARHGQSVIYNARRCEGLLKDYSARHRREVSVLVSALEEHVPEDLRAAPAGSPRGVLLKRLARRLSDNSALSEPAAAWAVNSWALALGLISEDELKAIEEEAVSVMAAAEVSRGDGGGDPPAGGAARTPSNKSTVGAPADAASVVASAGGDGDYLGITEALANVAPGGRVLVRPGVYVEGIVLDKRVNIVGDGPRDEIVVRVAGASCLKSNAEAARVAGLTLRGAAGGGSGSFAVDVLRGELVLEDCDISSETLSCVAVHGPEAAPLIKRCRIHDGADSGLYFFDGASGEVEDCEVYGNANVGAAITGGARAVIRRSKIYGGANAGVVAWGGGDVILEGCEVYGNRLANLGVSDGAKLTARSCHVHEGENSGVFVHREGEAVLESCELYGHREAEAAVTTRGRLFLNGCRAHGGHDSGVLVREGGQALLQGCEVSDNSGSGASVGSGSVLAVVESIIYDNARFGVEAAAGATARVEDSELTGNGLGPWGVEYGAEVESVGNVD
ncbi:MAG TPA: right-handed parallel beta-helix repeat-containing protein [Pyrinomonadaceae bacterium]|nr:right-handed parallel beta-helix repeat-containing protein [Pyrinomonadaceae bacterium]